MVRKRRYSKSARIIHLFIVATVIIIIIYCKNSDTTDSNGISSNFYIPKRHRVNKNFTKVAAVEISTHGQDNLPPLQIVIEENRKFLKKNGIDETTYNEKKIIFLISTWRSGSTFFGEVFSSHPAVFYHYEPLSRFGFQELSSDNGLEDALTDLRYLSDCQYEKLEEYLTFVRNDSSIFKFNEKIYPGCQYLSEDCYLPNFPSAMCNMFPIHLFKILRIKVSDLKPFLEDRNVHILLLIRDPRAIFASRRKLQWCQETNRCLNMSLQCSITKDDLSSIHELKPVYPGQIHVVRYEDAANTPVQEFKKIFNEIGIPWHSLVLDSIELHTQREMDTPWSTYRISQTRVDKWKDELAPELISHIQDTCETILRNLSYSRVDNTF